MPKEYTLTNELAPIIELLLHWRKLERQCWKFLLAEKEREISAQDVGMFLKLRDVIIGLNGATPKDREELFKILDQYMRTSLMGNFPMRMRGLHYLATRDVAV